MSSSEVIRHRGRRFKRNSVSSSAIIDSTKTLDHPNPSPPLRTPDPPPVSSSCSPVTHHATTITSCSRPVSLTPAHPPLLTSKGRPMSAKGRPRSGSYIGTDFKREFSLKQSQPLPPIGSSLHHQPLYEVDSAVDLEYNSHCCTPEDTPLYSLSVRQNNVTREEVHYEDYLDKKLLQDSSLQQETLTTQPVNASNSLESASGKKQSSPTAPLDRDASKEKKVQLCLKLPSGERLLAEFTTSQTISELVSCAQQYCDDSDLSECEVATNSVPRQVITNWQLTLAEAGITVRTLLYLSIH